MMNTLLSNELAARASSPPHTGERYCLREQVGLGGSSRIFRAWDSVEQRTVALKLLREDLSQKLRDRAIYQMQHEAHILEALCHPAILRLHDTDAHYLALDYVDGNPLTMALQQRRHGMPLDDVYVIGRNLCRVLSYLHQQQTVFCDLSANNVMVSFDGQMFLVDFGIAQHLGERRSDLLLGLGTPGYAAPELYPGSGYSISPATDIYSLGALLHYACSGDDPTRRSQRFLFPALPGRIPADFALLIKEMLSSFPDERPTLPEVKHALDGQRCVCV